MIYLGMNAEERVSAAVILGIIILGKWLFGPKTCEVCRGSGYYGHMKCSVCGGKGIR